MTGLDLILPRIVLAGVDEDPGRASGKWHFFPHTELPMGLFESHKVLPQFPVFTGQVMKVLQYPFRSLSGAWNLGKLFRKEPHFTFFLSNIS